MTSHNKHKANIKPPSTRNGKRLPTLLALRSTDWINPYEWGGNFGRRRDAGSLPTLALDLLEVVSVCALLKATPVYHQLYSSLI